MLLSRIYSVDLRFLSKTHRSAAAGASPVDHACGALRPPSSQLGRSDPRFRAGFS
jgi:hypothetical protein